MIILNSFNKIDILYRNYVKQFSNAYIKGSHLYVGSSLKFANNFQQSIFVQNIIKTYKNIFIDLYMNNNKIYEEVNNENLCVICLEELEEDIMDVCHKCNVKCHIKCVYDWYKKNNGEICPICLQTEEYYLNILQNNNDDSDSDSNLNNLDDIENIENNRVENNREENNREENNRVENNLENYVIVYEPTRRLKTCLTICCFMGLLCIILLINSNS